MYDELLKRLEALGVTPVSFESLGVIYHTTPKADLDSQEREEVWEIADQLGFWHERELSPTCVGVYPYRLVRKDATPLQIALWKKLDNAMYYQSLCFWKVLLDGKNIEDMAEVLEDPYKFANHLYYDELTMS
jgi:hypothetical protein